MPCRNDGWDDGTTSILRARDEAAAVACNCIKFLLAKGCDLPSLPKGAEEWYRSHRERDKQSAIEVARRKLAELYPLPKDIREANRLIDSGFLPSKEKKKELEFFLSEYSQKKIKAEAELNAIIESDPMNPKHGLY